MSFPIFFFPRLSRNQICGYFIHHFLFRFFLKGTKITIRIVTNWRKFWLSGHSWRKVSLVGRDETMSNKFCLILFPRSSCPKLLDHIFLKGRSRVAVIAYL